VLLKELTELSGVSGNEGDVREYIKKAVKEYADEIRIDSMGNLIAHKKGVSSKYKVMLAAHMDEVGFIITGYGEAGSLKFKPIGAIDERILAGKRVVIGNSKICGIIDHKPESMQGMENSNGLSVPVSIYIGCDRKDETEKLVQPGDYATFLSEYFEMEGDYIKSKALDDRTGCVILMEMLKKRYTFDFYACFTVQEEIGLRGAEVASYTVKPDYAIVIDTVLASDISDIKKHNYISSLGKGPVITVMDQFSYANSDLFKLIKNTAIENNIDIQCILDTVGGNDAGRIQCSNEGVRVASINIPCRYIHSAVSIINKHDLESCLQLVSCVLTELDINHDKISANKNGGKG
ncbi:MAG: M42 family peptidase, partial [Clostridia bacterium]|jgi:endoglucanase|nr:M42 family peptidase [Clostridia bacterium]